ncbi:MAG: hypothetical protein HOJ07_07630 [Rhodospirillaceae bacterium]|jgi:hypothetical protein|nr:hypothetical protein [Rhodospirillaceae bacterium]MBT5777985.1 hypothetical protein [Rhodospirillaceae bacterium]
MRPGRFCALVLLLLAAVLGACTGTNYRSLNASTENETPLSRDVYFEVSDAFYADPPECVFVLPPTDAGVPPLLAEVVEQALALRLSQKIRRVIGPHERRAAERDLALDTRTAVDRHYFARTEHCPASLEWRLTAASDSNFLVWSRKKIGLQVRLARAEDDTALWQAAHTTSRSGGGLPLSLISLPIAAVEATVFSQDTDQLPSMVDDVVRRLVVTLPSVR